MINPINYSLTPKLREFYDRSKEKQPSGLSKNRMDFTNFFNINTNTSNSKCLTDNIRTSIFYINDFHGKAMNMERAVTASNMFDSFIPENNISIDKLKLSSGDTMLGEAIPINKVAMKFLKMIGVTATAVGNHECDMKYSNIEKEIGNMKPKMLACNIKEADNSKVISRIEKSYIQEINGNKYGIIGTIPSDLKSRVKYGKAFQEKVIEPANLDETIEAIQKEIDKLKGQGINKIILLSHSGYSYDTEIAKRTDGLDIILGGHSHTLLKDIKSGVNLFNSKSGEPVIITQAGRDGKNFGILNLEFDNNGIIKIAQNNVALTRNFSRQAIARRIFEDILGKPEIIGEVRTAPPIIEKDDLITPNPLAYYGADAIKEKTGADISLVGAANIRGSLEQGKVDTAGIEEISPFKNKIVKINYTEKEIVDAIKFCAKSFVNRNNKPGIMYASGLKYTVSKNGEVLNLTYVNKSGKEYSINLTNPRKNKIYSVAINDYYSSGNDGLSMLNKFSQATEKYEWDLNTAIGEKIKNSEQPIDILDDGRIQIVD